MKLSKVKRKELLDLDSYVNIETGESLSDEYCNISIDSDTGKSVLSYDNYSIISSDAIFALQRVLNDSDLAKVVKLSVVLKTELNIIFNDNTPHTNKSLQKYLMIRSEAMFYSLIKRLMKVGVLYQMKGLVYGRVRVIYLMNPYICRKRKVFENKVLDVFKNFNYN